MGSAVHGVEDQKGGMSLLIQREVNVYSRLHIDRLPVQKSGSVPPLLHGIHRGGNQNRIARDHVEFAHYAGLGDYHVEFYCALNALAFCFLGIDWPNLVYQRVLG